MSRYVNKMLAKIFTKWPSLLEMLVDKSEGKKNNNSLPTVEEKTLEAELKKGIPWYPLKKPLKDCRIALITTAGVHLKSDKPFDMENSNGDTSFRVIPSASVKSELMITHDYYDHSDADKDINIVFPIDRLRGLEESGEIASLSEYNFGLMGHILGPLVGELLDSSSKKILEMLKADNVDCVLLVPG